MHLISPNGFPISRRTPPVAAPSRGATANPFRPLPESSLAVRPNQADFLFGAFPFASIKVPPAKGLSGPVGALRLAQNGRAVNERLARSPLPLISGIDDTPDFAKIRVEFLNSFRGRLQTLRQEVTSLRTAAGFNTRTAATRPTGAVQVDPGAATPLGQTTLLPRQLAQGQVLASDVLSTTALGLSGRFRINGVGVTVAAGDSIFQIRDKINLGEDVNGNAILDGTEDLNLNGVADVIQVNGRGKGPGVFIIEDANGNGSLDPAEDVNGNERLDGGIAETRVAAAVEGGRLLLTSLTGGASAIDLQDKDGVLLKLGFFELNAKGLPIQKEVQLDLNPAPPVNLNTLSQKAELTVSGVVQTSDGNVFSNAIPDAKVTLNKVSTRTVTAQVSFDASSAVSRIQSIFNAYNNVLTTLNSALTDNGLLAEDLETQTVRNGLISESQARLKTAEKRNKNVEELFPFRLNPRTTGLSSVNTEKFDLRDPFLAGSANSFFQGPAPPVKAAGNLLFQRLSQVGIRTLQDDTVAVDAKQLKRALETNAAEVTDLFFNDRTGILALLEPQLDSLLRENLGRLDLKIDRLQDLAELPSEAGETFRRVVENRVLEASFRNLITIA